MAAAIWKLKKVVHLRFVSFLLITLETILEVHTMMDHHHGELFLHNQKGLTRCSKDQSNFPTAAS
jgi:hypothetical protein